MSVLDFVPDRSNQTHRPSVRVIAKRIRELWSPSVERQPCYVCHRYASITEAHHVIPVFQLAKLCHTAGVDGLQLVHLPVRFVWLCPNHHRYFHHFERNSGASGFFDAITNELTAEEIQGVLSIFKLQNYGEVQQFVEACYDENHA